MLSTLLDRVVYEKLSDRELEHLSHILDAEVIKNPEIQKLLKEKVDAYVASPKKTGG